MIIASLLMTATAAAQEHVSFPTKDGGQIQADVYGKGDRAVVLAHGGRFNKESWKKQAEALRGPVSVCWRSTSEATASRQAPARPILWAPRYIWTCSPRFDSCENRVQRAYRSSVEAWEGARPAMPRSRLNKAKSIAWSFSEAGEAKTHPRR